jgi:hypothetical protein
MAIKKQEFYEGAALHALAKNGCIRGISYEAPFFLLNNGLLVYFKHSTKGRSPWGFTFMPSEQALLQEAVSRTRTIIAFICGSDGVAAVAVEEYLKIAAPRDSSVHVSCFRLHGQYYDIFGPNGKLGGKVSPSLWRNILKG